MLLVDESQVMVLLYVGIYLQVPKELRKTVEISPKSVGRGMIEKLVLFKD